MNTLKTFKQLFENFDEELDYKNLDLYGYTWNELYYIIEDELDEPKEQLINIIDNLKEIENYKFVTLYRVVYSKNKEDIDKSKLGHHFVQDPSDFHEEMLDYLYRNATKNKSDLKETDLFLVKVKVDPKYIDFKYSIMTNCQHPYESEITVSHPENCEIIEIDNYYN